MVTLKSRLSLSDLLIQPDVVDQLRDQFQRIQGNLTTTINEAAKLTELSEAQLRYAEARGLLSTNRGAVEAADDQPRGQRRYPLDSLLRARLIAYILDRGYSLSEIFTFMESNQTIIQDLLETTSLRLKPVLDSADDVLFKRFFVPRALYYAMALIFERDAVADAGLVFPVRASAAELATLRLDDIETVDDLIRLGHIFVAWRGRGQPFSTFITAGNPFEPEMQVRLKPFSHLMTEASDRMPANLPAYCFVAYGPQAAPELAQADKLVAVRRERDQHNNTSAEREVIPRAVAGRLIAKTQQLVGADVNAIWRKDNFLNDVRIFNAPEMINPALGDAVLNRLADTIVELGGPRRVPDETAADAPPGDSEQPLQWRFACVMTPNKLNASLKAQELMVRAQSKGAPHRVGVTTTSPMFNGGLTFRAFSSGRVAYREDVTPLDPSVSYVNEEMPIGSAIAAPAVDGYSMEHSQPPAVLYVASRFSSAFDRNDILLLRVMGRLVGEIVQAYNSRMHLPNVLTDALADPEIVDSYFAAFRSDTDFISDLQAMLNALKSREPAKDGEKPVTVRTSLTLIGFDVDNYSAIHSRHGDRVARMVIREIGDRLKQRMSRGVLHGVSVAYLYRIFGDRFFVLIGDEDRGSVLEWAIDARKNIQGVYGVEGDSQNTLRIVGGQSSAAFRPEISVSVRMVGMWLTVDDLRARVGHGSDALACAVNLHRLLDDGLQQASEPSKDAEDARAVWMTSDRPAFRPVRDLIIDDVKAM